MKKPGLGAKIYVVLLLMFMYLPILVVALFSFNASTARTPTVFTGFSLQWYRQLFDDTRGFGGALKTSLLLALYSVSLSTVLGVLGAVGQVRRQYRATLGGRMRRAASNLFESIALLPVMLPEIILGVAFMLLFAALRLPAGMTTLTIAHTTFCVPYIYVMVKSRLRTMDEELELAARDLGASSFKALCTITLPLLRPAIFSGMLLALAMSLDDFVISFFVNGPETTTLPLKIYSSARVGVSSQVNALCVVMLLVVFALVGLSQLALRRRES